MENTIKEQLIKDILKQAKEDKVYILDLNSEFAEGYDTETMEEYLSHCNLPESVVNYMKEHANELEGTEFIESSCRFCDKYFEFIDELFDEALAMNEVPAFQLAQGKNYCNYTSAYRTMTADYECAKSVLIGELGDNACGMEHTIREDLYDFELYVFGNELGKELFNRCLDDLETEYNTTGIEKLAELYKKSLEEENNREENKDGLDFLYNVFTHSAKRRYEINKRDMVVDIIDHVMTEGISILHKDMPESVNRFIELSGCDDEAVLDLYKIAAEKAEDYKIAYMHFGDDMIVLIRDYVEAYKFLQSLVENTSKTLAELELDPRSNSLAQAFIIKYLAEKSNKTADDYWDEMVDIMYAFSQESIPVEEAVEEILGMPCGIIYTAIKKELHNSYRFYHRDIYEIKREIENAYKKML